MKTEVICLQPNEEVLYLQLPSVIWAAIVTQFPKHGGHTWGCFYGLMLGYLLEGYNNAIQYVDILEHTLSDVRWELSGLTIFPSIKLLHFRRLY